MGLDYGCIITDIFPELVLRDLPDLKEVFGNGNAPLFAAHIPHLAKWDHRKVKKPSVTVKDGSTKLAASQYTVTYASGRKNVGKYNVKVTLKGNYSGSKTVAFKINPKGTSLKTLTPDALLPGAKETLLLLRERGIKTSVGSASKNAPEILERIGLLPLLDKVSCGLDTSKSKPDPEVFLIAARKMELEPEVCLVVEDSAAGIVAATNGGMKSLAVGPLYQQLGGTFCARDLSQVEDWDALLNA